MSPDSEVGSSILLAAPEASLQQTGSDPPSWLFLGKVTVNTGDMFAPVGRVTSTASVYRLEKYGTENFKWFNFFLNQTIQPGIAIYDSTFRMSSEGDRVFSNNADTNFLVEHGPKALIAKGPDVITYDIGVEAGVLGSMVTAGQSMSYFLKHTTVTDFSQGIDIIWLHDLESRTESGKLTFQIIPGWTLRVSQSQPIDITGIFTTGFDRFTANSVETESPNFSFRISGG